MIGAGLRPRQHVHVAEIQSFATKSAAPNFSGKILSQKTCAKVRLAGLTFAHVAARNPGRCERDAGFRNCPTKSLARKFYWFHPRSESIPPTPDKARDRFLVRIVIVKASERYT